MRGDRPFRHRAGDDLRALGVWIDDTHGVWATIEDPDAFVRRVLAAEADDIPEELISAHPWVQMTLDIRDLEIDEDLVRRHDATALHLERRGRFVAAMERGDDLPPLIALGADRFLVDGYARVRALRYLRVSSASALVQAISVDRVRADQP